MLRIRHYIFPATCVKATQDTDILCFKTEPLLRQLTDRPLDRGHMRGGIVNTFKNNFQPH